MTGDKTDQIKKMDLLSEPGVHDLGGGQILAVRKETNENKRVEHPRSCHNCQCGVGCVIFEIMVELHGTSCPARNDQKDWICPLYKGPMGRFQVRWNPTIEDWESVKVDK
jgi:hypothetical protein